MADHSFSERLKLLKREKDFSQKQMAEAMDISTRYYQSLEAGKNTPSLETLQKTLTGLHVSYNEFFGVHHHKQMAESIKTAADVLSRVSNLSPDWQRFVFAIVYQDWTLVRGVRVDLSQALEAGLKTKK